MPRDKDAEKQRLRKLHETLTVRAMDDIRNALRHPKKNRIRIRSATPSKLHAVRRLIALGEIVAHDEIAGIRGKPDAAGRQMLAVSATDKLTISSRVPITVAQAMKIAPQAPQPAAYDDEEDFI